MPCYLVFLNLSCSLLPSALVCVCYLLLYFVSNASFPTCFDCLYYSLLYVFAIFAVFVIWFCMSCYLLLYVFPTAILCLSYLYPLSAFPLPSVVVLGLQINIVPGRLPGHIWHSMPFISTFTTFLIFFFYFSDAFVGIYPCGGHAAAGPTNPLPGNTQQDQEAV